MASSCRRSTRPRAATCSSARSRSAPHRRADREVRVLAATPSYPPSSRVGAWLATHQFLRHLVSCGHEVTAYAIRTRKRGYSLDGVHVESVMRGHDYARQLAAAADVVICHAGDSDYGAHLIAGTNAKLVTMVHGAGYNAIHPATSLAVFNSQSLRKKAQWTGPSVVCHP